MTNTTKDAKQSERITPATQPEADYRAQGDQDALEALERTQDLMRRERAAVLVLDPKEVK